MRLMSELFDVMSVLRGRHSYFFTEPGDLDFTGPLVTARVVLCTQGVGRTGMAMPKDTEGFRQFLTSMQSFMAGEGLALLAWNVKGFLTYAKRMSGAPFSFGRDVYDLAVLGGFCGTNDPMPQDYVTAEGLLRKLTSENDRAMDWYGEIYQPLALEVLPAVETVGLIDSRTRRPTYPSYRIEGQANGRLSASKSFKNSFNPHGIQENDAAALRPLGQDNVIVYLDYRHMEVSVLQWVSGDRKLAELQDTGRDLYDAVWETLSGSPVAPGDREQCKSVFLPAMYGMEAYELTKRTGVAHAHAADFLDRVRSRFPDASAYLRDKTSEAVTTGAAVDWCGRRREFSDKPHRARNFCVQAPASTVCLHKLVRLHREIASCARVCFHVHDGYGIVCPRKAAPAVAERAKAILEEPEDLFPGLRLACRVKVGPDVASVK